MPEFVHLHLHSEGSLLDGMCRTRPLLKRAVQQNMPAVAITDHGVMYKCIEFYKSAKDSGVKPILGCEVYVSPNSRFEKAGKGGGGSNYYHLILLAKDLEGYKNLMRLVSVGHLEGFYYKPRVDRETLAQYSKGLVCLSACLGAEVPQLIVQGRMEQARAAAAEHLEIFGRENYYFELQDHGIQDQYRVNEALLEMSRSMDIPLVATNDVHYVCAEDHLAHDLLLCIQTGATLTDTKRFKFESDQFYLASAEEMAQKFGNHPDALSNTLRVAEMCNVNLNFDQVSLPQFPVPGEFTPETYLLDLCRRALPSRFPNASDEHIRRLDYELSVINPKGFASYFLIVSDFVRHAQEQGISVRARGSAAGSIVAYLLGITNVDPLRYTLMFERFLNPDRVEMPDIDLDFADTRRDEMIEYAIGRYGRDHVAQIGTLGTLGARAAIRDAGRALNVPLPEVDRIAKLIQGLSPSIDDSIQSIPEMQKLYESSPDVRTLIDRARTVEGVVRSSGIHAAGVVISSDPLTDCVPLQRGGKDPRGRCRHLRHAE
ncbi:MAG: DNA polymerase III subunit alpha [Chloroflexi bacterium]|nr:DNA polymerase III subunit alpha [Chloroflexota bacterium]